MINEEILEFLFESNKIEGVYDADSLMQAMYAWNSVAGEEKLTKSVVLKTHKILMLHQKLRPDERGYFRQTGVRIGARFGKPFYAVPNLIDEWCRNANETITGDLDVSGYAPAMLHTMINNDHVRYEEIHPFIDGNGRTGRIFMNWQRVKCGLPILVIKESEKEEYYKWFT